MQKEKSKESASQAVDFPQGNWAIFIRESSVYIGHLNLVKSVSSTERYVGAMQFDENPQFGNIANRPFPAEIISFDPEAGTINFQILGAATLYNPDTSVPYQFVFEGYCEPDKLQGTAKVPKDFGNVPGLPGEDGDTVTWVSVGPTESPRKPSR